MSIPASPRVVVTGGASGLGRALCLALAKRAARIVIADLDVPGAEQTAHAVHEAGGQATVQRCDVSKFEQVEGLLTFADRAFGGADMIVNNAGVVAGGAVGSLSLRDWEWVVGINLWGVLYGCHVFAPRFRQQRSGHILNIASAAGLAASPDVGPYNVTKAGVISLSETLVAELSEFQVGVTVVCPTFFNTNIVASGRFTGSAAEAKGKSAQSFMEKSKLSASDVAARALRSCDKNQLYCVPMSDARWGWRLKRLLPELFSTRLLPWAIKDMSRAGER
jgi:NAD(P)-dependent dehydrogenase (short-subunit alcohol dehydrogenase family)